MAEVASDDSHWGVFGILCGEIRGRISAARKKDRIRLNPRPTKETANIPPNLDNPVFITDQNRLSHLEPLLPTGTFGNTGSILISENPIDAAKQRGTRRNLPTNFPLRSMLASHVHTYEHQNHPFKNPSIHVSKAT